MNSFVLIFCCVALRIADAFEKHHEVARTLHFADGTNLTLDYFLELYNPDTDLDDNITEDANEFLNFIAEHERQYEHAEEAIIRFQIFRNNLRRAEELNADLLFPVNGVNLFSDWTFEEFQQHASCLTQSDFGQSVCRTGSSVPNVAVPENLDYTEKGLVTSVKNQGNCGSCWAFSAIGNIEGQYAKKHKKLVDFSEQQLVDCYPTNGCNGGLMSAANTLLIKQGGLETDADYPYNARRNQCKFNKNKAKSSLSACEQWNTNIGEEALKKVLVSRGPLAVAINALALFEYQNDIMHGTQCSQHEGINHGVLLVGYGKDKETGMEYWKLKNSWGTKFGLRGYWKMQLGVNCLNIVDPDGEVVSAVVN